MFKIQAPLSPKDKNNRSQLAGKLKNFHEKMSENNNSSALYVSFDQAKQVHYSPQTKYFAEAYFSGLSLGIASI